MVVGIALGACCPKPFILGDFNHPGTPAYVCQSPNATTVGTCSVKTSTNEADWQVSATRSPIPPPLFSQCPNGVQRLFIKDPGSESTEVTFECAAPPITIGTAGPAAVPPPPAPSRR
jgi:hypothetical protein